MDDLGGVNRRNQKLRRVYGFAAHEFVALSQAIEVYLTDAVGPPRACAAHLQWR